MKKLLLFGLIFQSALQGAAFPADATISNLEVTIEKAISARSPVAGIIDNLERLAILYDAKGDALGQLQALRRISTLKGISKDKKMVNDVRVGNMFKELEARLKVQAGQTADMRRHYEAQIALGRLYHLRNDPGDSVKAEILFKAAVAQQEYPELRSQAYVALGDLNLSSQTPKGILSLGTERGFCMAACAGKVGCAVNATGR